MNEIITQKKNEIQKAVTEIVKVEMNEDIAFQVNQFIGNFLQCVQIDQNLQNIINPEIDYFVKIPNYIKKGLKTGQYDLMRKRDTGELLASVMQKGADGKKSIMANLTLREGAVVDDKYLKNMSDGMFNLVLQQQYQQISYQLTEILEVVKRIEKNQLYDKIGAINGAMSLLEDASKKTTEHRKIDIGNARQMLYATTHSIKEILQDRIGNFESVPNSAFMIKLKIWLGAKDYKHSKENEYNDIKTYFDYYILGVRLLAYAAYLEGREEKITEEFSKCARFLSGLDLTGIKSLENFYKAGRLEKEWFSRPQEFVDNVGQNFISICNMDYDEIEIKLSGKELLEVLSDD